MWFNVMCLNLERFNKKNQMDLFGTNWGARLGYIPVVQLVILKQTAAETIFVILFYFEA